MASYLTFIPNSPVKKVSGSLDGRLASQLSGCGTIGLQRSPRTPCGLMVSVYVLVCVRCFWVLGGELTVNIMTARDCMLAKSAWYRAKRASSTLACRCLRSRSFSNCGACQRSRYSGRLTRNGESLYTSFRVRFALSSICLT
jgi:hypothetical protein